MDRLTSSEARVLLFRHRDLMPERAQGFDRRISKARFDVDRKTLSPLPARGIERRLRIAAEVDEVRDHLKLALWLHEAAHHPEGHQVGVGCAFGRGQHAGNDRVVGALAGGDHVRVSGFEGEACAPVLHRDTGLRNHDARSETGVVALDPADAIAIVVGGGQVDGAARSGHARIEGLRP